MNPFTFQYPVKVVFNPEAENQVGQEALAFGKKVLIHHDSGAYLEDSGLLPRVRKSLDEAGVSYIELGGVRPNPRLSLMREGIELCRKEGIEAVIAIGGGSVMDSAKTIAMGAVYDGDVWDFALWKAQVKDTLPVITIPTMSGTGSEVSCCAMVCNDEVEPEDKRGIITMAIVPKVALINPSLQASLPKKQVASGCMDIISHTLTTWFTDTQDVYITDRMMEGLIESVIKYAPVVLENPSDYQARSQIAMAASLAVVFMCGFERNSCGADHAIENPLTTMHHLAHGTTLAIICPAWMRYVYKRDLPRFVQFANRLMGVPVNPFDMEGTALEGIVRFEQFIKDRLGLPTHMSEIGVENSDIDFLANVVTNNGTTTVGGEGPYKLDIDDVKKIYEIAK